MNELFQAFISCAVMLALLGVLITLPSGKVDSFFLLRPVGRYLFRMPARACRQMSKLCYHWSRTTWRQASRSPWYMSVALATLSAALGIIGFVLSIPADILGTSVKRS